MMIDPFKAGEYEKTVDATYQLLKALYKEDESIMTKRELKRARITLGVLKNTRKNLREIKKVFTTDPLHD